MNQARPLLTVVVRHYNNAPFVEAALQSTFSQTYRPLEILFIDDCSTDGGFEIARQAIERYQGPHKIVVFRNPVNVGCSALNSRILELSHGEIIVYADADDISLPNRCEEIQRAFESGGSELLGVISHFDHIDASGAPIEGLQDGFSAGRARAETWSAEMLARDAVGPSGAVVAFRRQVLAVGTPLDGLRIGDDLICGFRSLTLGKMATVPKVLVLRRVHGSNVSGAIHLNWTGAQLWSWFDKALRERMLIPGVMLRDLWNFQNTGLITPVRAHSLFREVRAFARRMKLLRVAPRLPAYRRHCVVLGIRDSNFSLRQDVRAVLQRTAPGLAMAFLRRNRMNIGRQQR